MSKTNALFFCFLIAISICLCGFDYIRGASESIEYPLPFMYPIQEWEIVDFDLPAGKDDIDRIEKIINEMQREIKVLKSRLSALENSEKI